MAAGTIPCGASDPCPVSLLAVAAPEKINGHGRANKNDESFDPGLRQFLRIMRGGITAENRDRKSTRLNSSHDQISYAVFCLKKKTKETSERTERSLYFSRI